MLPTLLLNPIPRTFHRLFHSTMSLSRPTHKSPPCPVNRGMLQLDRSAFTAKVRCLAVKVEEGVVGGLTRDGDVKTQLLRIPKVRTIEVDPNTSTGRLLLLGVESEDQLSHPVLEALKPHSKGFIPYDVELDYAHWTATEVLQAILPEELINDCPSSYTLTGHIAHLNLRDEYLPYKHLIGQVLLDKNNGLRTVVNKLDTIDNEFRVFKMEVIAGEDDLIAHTREASCTFTFDFSTVYWNSRLSSEHERLVSLFSPGEVVADVMAGVGPFAVPAAKKGVRVRGNDLNPDSWRWMGVNRRDNKVEQTLQISNIDGREFIRTVPLSVWRHPFPPTTTPTSAASVRKAAKEARRAREAAKASLSDGVSAMSLSQPPSTPPAQMEQEKLPPQTIDHFIMNLPNSALEFLDAYGGCYTPLRGEEGWVAEESVGMPLVHTYCFTKEGEREGAERDICERATGYLGHPVKPDMEGYNLHMVRSVAPSKDMYCLTFRLPRAVAFREV